MQLIDVYQTDGAMEFLYQMLANRNPKANISHRTMPTWEEHESFIRARPYAAWYIITDNEWIGSIYLTKADEIGIFIREEDQGLGYGSRAVRELMKLHGKRRYLANIAPANCRSEDFFRSLGFKPLQCTYEMET